MNSKYLTPVLVVAVIGAVGAAAFFAGVQFKESESGFTVHAMDQGKHHMMQYMQSRHAESGEVVIKDGNTITVKSENGLTETIILTGDTDISKTTNATVNDINVGDQVMVFGQEENGTFTAEAIDINPLTHKRIYE
jgi:hypothetical protein